MNKWYLGVSRTPVRDGLRRLESHGLLEFREARGLVVVSLTKRQVIELYAVMEMLEASAARLAAQNATAIEIEMARHVLEVFDTVENDPRRLARLSREFRDFIYAAAHNEYLLKSLRRLWDALASVSHTTYQVEDRPRKAAEEHWAIRKAVEARQPCSTVRQGIFRAAASIVARDGCLPDRAFSRFCSLISVAPAI